jgi:hypothetical protein
MPFSSPHLQSFHYVLASFSLITPTLIPLPSCMFTSQCKSSPYPFPPILLAHSFLSPLYISPYPLILFSSSLFPNTSSSIPDPITRHSQGLQTSPKQVADLVTGSPVTHPPPSRRSASSSGRTGRNHIHLPLTFIVQCGQLADCSATQRNRGQVKLLVVRVIRS